MRIVRQRLGDVEVMHLMGVLDALTAHALRMELLKVLERPPRILVLDLAELTAIDSMGIGMLIKALKQVRAAGGDVRVLHVVGMVRRLFYLLHLDRTMTVCDSLEAAMASGVEP